MSKIYDGIMGLVVGDALGVPFEFKRRDTFKAVDMVGYGTYNQTAGTWSDDSSMTLATLESLGRCKRIDLADIMRNFYRWYVVGDFTPHGQVFDVGNTTRTAIQRYKKGAPLYACGGYNIMDNGNGSLMRILPLAFIEHSVEDVFAVSTLTHAHRISLMACVRYVEIAEKLIAGAEKQDVLESKHVFPAEFRRIKKIGTLSRDEIKSTGYVIDTLEAALWCFMTTESYRDCVLKAVNLGEDTDTIAAVAGGLAGIYYGVGGEKGIPQEWIEQIARKEWIQELCVNLNY